MSWETIETECTCPCGNVTYTISDDSNDWGQNYSSWRMECADCRDRYSLHSYPMYCDAMYSTGHRWVSTTAFKQAQSLKEAAKDAVRQAAVLARSRYLEVFVAHNACESKKAVWAALHSVIRYYKSLGTFYRHTKGRPNAEYVAAEVFSEHHIEAALKILRLQDIEFSDLVRSAAVSERESEKLLTTTAISPEA